MGSTLRVSCDRKATVTKSRKVAASSEGRAAGHRVWGAGNGCLTVKISTEISGKVSRIPDTREFMLSAGLCPKSATRRMRTARTREY